MNKANTFLYSFIGLIIVQMFMSMEEIFGHFPSWIGVITEKIHHKVSFIPAIQISEPVFMIISLIIIIILFVLLGFVFMESEWTSVLTLILGIIEIINGGLHILTSLYFMRYIPGSASAVFLIILGFMVIFLRPSVRREEPMEIK
jgi:hypothetical protein